MSNPGGVDLNVSPYFDDYNEDKKFARILFRPGRAVQARELTQLQTLFQKQIQRFSGFFFKEGAIVDGCEQYLDLNLNFAKLQSTYNGSEIDVEDFKNSIVFSANTGIKAYCGVVADIESSDPKTLYINYLSSGSYVLSVNVAPTTITSGNTLTLITGNTATIEAVYTDPITSVNKIIVSNLNGALTTTNATTIDSTGATIAIAITGISDKTANTYFDDNETLFTANTSGRAFSQTLASNAIRNIVDQGLATETVYTKASKITIAEGTLWVADHFVKHSSQTIILDKYSNVPSYKVGVVPTKTFVDYITDNTLVDNAQGTPNFQSPGADRFKIDTVLTKVPKDEQTDEKEFITLLEVDAGIIKKKKQTTIENKLEDVIAQRTYEESGDYTLSDPVITVREHLVQGANGGRYSSAEGGNNNLLLLEVDPFVSYVSGYRNQLLVRTPAELRKGLDTQYVEQTKTQINYGQYIEVNEMTGGWDFMEATKIDLYDTVQKVITNETFSDSSVTGTKIGEARVRSVEYISGVVGTASAVYNIYLYEVTMNSGKIFSQVRSLYDSATPNRFADVILSASGSAVLKETSFNSLVFPLPYKAIRTIRDTSENVESGFRFKKKFNVTFNSGVATIATTDSSETFIGTGLLSATQKNNFYAVVVNNAGADVQTSNLTGTVSVGAGANTVTGVGTSFRTALNVGDIIRVNSLERRVSVISSDTSLTLEDPHTTGASANTFTKILPTGALIPLDLFGGSAAARTVNVSSPGTVVIDIKEPATFTAEVIVSMDRANAREKKKTLTFSAQTNINPNTHPSGISGPFGLGYGDIYQLRAVYQSSSFAIPATTSNTNVTAYYTLDNGQRDYAYEHGRIRPITGYVPTGRLLAVFDHFTHDTSQGLGYTSVDSYPINDAASSNTTINTKDISVFTSPTTGTVYNLRDCVDFRPIKTANTALNPVDDGTYQVPAGGLRIPEPASDFDADLIYYKGRISKLYVDQKGFFGINDGVPATAATQNPVSPPKLPDTLELSEITIPPYPSQPKDVQIRLLKNRRFTMRDIGKLNERVENLEYYTTLNFLEKQATDKTELDDGGLDRFKNGIIVDAFTGYSTANPLNSDYSAAINKNEKYLTAKQDNSNTVGVLYTSNTISTTVRTPGNKIFLPYAEEENLGLKQIYASRELRLAEELNYIWNGEMTIVPFVDNWIDTTNDPTKAIVYDDTGDADNWRALVDAWNTEVAPLNTRFTGTSTEIVNRNTTTTTAGLQVTTVVTGTERTTADAFNQLATVTSPASPRTVTGDRVVDISATLWMRSRDIVSYASGLKNNSRMYAFFDGEDVTEFCYQIRLLGATTLESLNDLYDSDGRLAGQGTNWEVIADGATDPLRVNNNEIYVLFEIPEKKFYVGQREFKLTDSSLNSTGYLTAAKNTFFAQGISQTKSSITINSRPSQVSFTNANVRRQLGRRLINERTVEISRSVTFLTPEPDPWVPDPAPIWVPVPLPTPWLWRDPVSQSFFIDPETYFEGCYVTSIDLYFKSKSIDTNRKVRVEIREMINGYPSTEIIGTNDVAVLNSSDIQVSEDASRATKFTFKNPIYLSPGNEYCFTVKPENNDPDFSIWVAELGQIDVTNPELQTRIESAYNTGVLFTSANDRTWSARQNLDIKFTMRVANFSLTSQVAYWTNIATANTFQYDSVHPIIGDQVLSGTSIDYAIQMSDSSFTSDEEFLSIKNYERVELNSRKQISNSTQETTNGFKSLQFRAVLTTSNKYISPYIDNENIRFAFSRNIVNADTSTSVAGTVTYSAANNIVVGSGTDFSNTVFVGEYANFGNNQYRRVISVANNTYLTVENNFVTSNAASQTITIRNEENPTGPYTSQSRYITRTVALNDGFEASDLVVYLNVNRPPGTSVKVYYKILSPNDTDRFDDKFYTQMELVGNEYFTLNKNDYKEEKYIVPSSLKTGGEQLLYGTVAVSNSSTTVTGTSTRFLEQLRIGDILAVGTSRTQRVITTIANNTSLTVESVYPTVASTQDAFKVLNNEISYTTPDQRAFSGIKYFSLKIVFSSSNPNYAPSVKNLRGIALA